MPLSHFFDLWFRVCLAEAGFVMLIAALDDRWDGSRLSSLEHCSADQVERALKFDSVWRSDRVILAKTSNSPPVVGRIGHDLALWPTPGSIGASSAA